MIALAYRSLLNRRFTLLLTVLAIALSVALLLGIERLRQQARDGFTQSVSGTDLIVAARGNDLQILLAAVFGIGSTSNTLDWDAVEALRAMPEVAWAVPISQGDNHRGHPVIGTEPTYFERFQYGRREALAFAQGRSFDTSQEAVIGAEVATRQGYGLGTTIVNAHGAGDVSFDLHDEAPFTVVGILAPTGTPVDRMVYVPLEGFDAIHADSAAAPATADPFAAPSAPTVPAEANAPYRPKAVNAVFIGLASPTAILNVQRKVNQYEAAPLTAVMPAVSLQGLWQITGTAEDTLRAMSWAVVVAGLIGLVVMLAATLEGRRREFAILRSVGATPAMIMRLILGEALLITGLGICAGLILLYLLQAVAAPLLAREFGLHLGWALSSRELMLLGAVLLAALLASLAPAWRTYRATLADGLTPRL
ncbi:ABC transporter permease [Pseudoruegeria sp. SHC-113]|uniref:ABC transporter permease n=1 Tax=Pseudoruegeria sp. SHC-113 TaxID=2855439 RepID=UPI0021BAE590|nr:ABC transporter permease [Pseudoruegeria sp. SHC-113]MCT8161141.1 ABC transporter permease [Pseudoruegeria sp. SHC-113]